MSILTIEHLMRLHDALQPKLTVSVSDREDPTVKSLEALGYRVEISMYMPPRMACLQDPAHFGVLYLDEGQAFLAKNTALEWMNHKPEVTS